MSPFDGCNKIIREASKFVKYHFLNKVYFDVKYAVLHIFDGV